MNSLTNLVMLRGNLGNDPELRHTGKGVPVTNFTMATEEVYRDDNGTRQKRVEWHKITVWGKTARACAENLIKGQEVTVLGKLQTRKWRDKEDNDRETTEIHSTQVQFGRLPNSAFEEEGEYVEDEEQEVSQDR